ncbi:hypothetical protein [Streptomyces sp. NPDC127112]|uniref:hypothetical protein n=1 Tax=Streptomyces sp. NPDC127112 TaxID=3345364 RepID=UPI003638191C
MAGPGGREVGRIHIKVLPDTDGFRQRLQGVLEAIEERARVSVQVEADTSRFEAEIATATRGRTATINVDADVGAAEARIARTTRPRRGPTLNADLDAGRAEAAIMRLTRRRRVNIQARVDRGFLGSVARAMDGTMKIVSGAGEVMARAMGTAFTSATEGARTAAQGFAQMGTSLAGAAANVPALAIAIPILMAIAGAISAVVGAAAVLAGAWLGLVAVLVAPIAPIGAAAALIAFDESLSKTKDKVVSTFKAIAETFSHALTDSDMLPAIEEGLGKVQEWAAASQTALKEFFDAGARFVDPMLTSMQRLVSEFAGPLTDALNQLADSDFADQMITGMGELGKVLGEFFLELSKYGTEFGAVFAALAPMLDPIVDGFARFAGEMAKIAPDIMVQLGEAIGKIFDAASDNSDSIQSMAESFIRMTEAFAQMLPLILQVGSGLATFTAGLMEMNAGFAAIAGESVNFITDTAWPAVKDFFGFTKDETENTKTVFNDLGNQMTQTASGIQAQVVAMTSQVATAHGQMANGVLTDWTNIQQYSNQVNSGIGTASENAAIRVAAASAQAEQAWQTALNTVQNEGNTVFDTLAAMSQSAAASVNAQAEIMAQKALESSGTAKDGITSNMNGAAQGAKGAYDSMSSASQQTWNEIVAQASKGSSEMNVTSVKAWEALGTQVKTVLDGINSSIQTHSTSATTQLGAVPVKAGDDWGKFPPKVQAACNTALSTVQNACNQMKAALNSVTSQTYTINIRVNTTQVVTQIKQAAADAKAAASAMKSAAAPGARSMPAPVRGVPTIPGVVDTFRSLAADGYQSGLDMARSALNGAQSRRDDRSQERPVQNVTVNAQTDANPFAIGREVAWAIRGM